jgi:hypothetical protein
MAWRTLIADRLPVARMLLGFAAGMFLVHLGARVQDAIVAAAAVPVIVGLWTEPWEYPHRK